MGLDPEAFASKTRRGPRCGFGLIVDTLDPDDLAVLRTAMADPMVHSTQIAKVLTAEGYEVSHFVVNRHRRGDCLCGR